MWNALRLHTVDACVVICCTSEKKNSCTYEGVEIYKFLPILNANFMLFFISSRRRKKENFYSQFMHCAINNDAKPAWLNRKSNECVRDTVGISRAYDNRDFLFMYSFMHTFHKFYASQSLPATTRHPREFLSSSSVASWCKELSSFMYDAFLKKREKFWCLSITRFMHFYHPVGCMYTHSYKFTICTQSYMCRSQRKAKRGREEVKIFWW